ncbi:PBSX family phage terminase large subunit [Bacteroides cellulosilyticus]|jgi:phage terminase large subunit|uniref:Terminase n=1 Tax=Bacteroides cellulosilyticus TaxID=246787 RepID=A0A642PPE4_9BACE|nr:terminase large subunit [Bacteroides cellulosilyticus]KAA5412717.1 terminase [Bacteroides cellulosilyticus]MBX9085689.1 terminase [Bacteroides cellulosilyticus]DAM18312.1 MAG TPA: terminase large subunit [Caudoviricetes sp.]
MMSENELFEVSDLFMANKETEERTVVNQGGTSSGKTYSIMQLLFEMAMNEPDLVVTIVGQDIPNLKKGAYRDAKTILNQSPILQVWFPYINESERVIRCINGSVLEFTSFKDEQDAKSGKRDVLFINECDGIAYGIYWQLDMRTRRKVFLDYNPSARFWVHDNVIGRKNVKLIISDHRCNPFLSKEEHEKIEKIEDYELWKVYARGKTGKLKGLIFPEFRIVDRMPEVLECKGNWYGLDFGYTNDPTALENMRLAHGELWVDELLFEAGYDNPMIARVMKTNGIMRRDVVIADCAEPKSISEINSFGFNVRPSSKGPDSIKNGIQILQRYKINVTRRSTGIIQEMKRYKWKVDKNGVMLNVPIEVWNHGIDAIRYVSLKTLSARRVSSGAKATYMEVD